MVILVFRHERTELLKLQIEVLCRKNDILHKRFPIRIVSWHILRSDPHHSGKIWCEPPRPAAVQTSEVAHKKTLGIKIYHHHTGLFCAALCTKRTWGLKKISFYLCPGHVFQIESL